MKWTTDKLNKTVDNLKRERYESGAYSEYVKLTKNIGAKLYSSKKTRDGSMARQALAAKHLLAPKVGEKLSFKMRGSNYYGYLTQNAKIIKDLKGFNWSKVGDLQNKLKLIGLQCHDLHNENVAVIGERVVTIDFCPISSRIIRKKKRKSYAKAKP
jgi:hypothetical protein